MSKLVHRILAQYKDKFTHEIHSQFSLRYLLNVQARFSQSSPTHYFRGMLPRQHVLSLCQATVDHGMCNMGQSYSLFCGELWLSLS